MWAFTCPIILLSCADQFETSEVTGETFSCTKCTTALICLNVLGMPGWRWRLESLGELSTNCKFRCPWRVLYLLVQPQIVELCFISTAFFKLQVWSLPAHAHARNSRCSSNHHFVWLHTLPLTHDDACPSQKWDKLCSLKWDEIWLYEDPAVLSKLLDGTKQIPVNEDWGLSGTCSLCS